MNAPLRQESLGARDCPGQDDLYLFAFFHLNLAFSSIEEERRADVIARCYWPLLELAEQHVIGLEVSGYTLEEIATRDPAWIARARVLIAEGRIELIGSGYSQMIGPLVPARVTAENLRLGVALYEKFLGVRPRLALVGEQAYSAGLVGLYLDAGYDALIMDYDNPAAHHSEWPTETAYRPQRALGADGRSIALIWSNTVAFQQLQRLAHGDIAPDRYQDFVGGRRGAAPRALCLYASDAEIFDFRPGRFKTEEKLSAESEWGRITRAFAALGNTLRKPSSILTLMPDDVAPLRLECAPCPVPVKKQRKYNLARWAVTGRDNIAINAACERIYRGLVAGDPGEKDWKELCYLWASDFRTHLTEKRWVTYRNRLAAVEARWRAKASPAFPEPGSAPVTERHISIETPLLQATLDRRRGLAIESLHFKGQSKPALGGLPHGFFDSIALQADWYTGDCVFEAPGEHKLTDLEWCEAKLSRDANGDVLAFARIDTPKGPIEKRMRFCAHMPRVEFDLSFDWPDWSKGVLRLGHFTLLPDAFDIGALKLTTCNGGGTESFSLAGQTVDHGAAVSFLVSSSHGLGLSEGWAAIGDGVTDLRVEVDRTTAPLLGLLTHRAARSASGKDSLFCQIALSASELDDTSKPAPYRAGPRRFRFSVSAL
jgi:hypothetical protein